MFTVHLISDLYFGFNEPTPEKELDIPEEVDLIILNGNIGEGKRSVYYAHELCQKYPDIQVVYNFGEMERYWNFFPKESEWEIDDGMKMRKKSSIDWPKNLHWKDCREDNGMLITLRNGQTVDVFTDYGYPNIISYEGEWEDTYWYKNYCVVAEYIHNLHKWPIRPVEADIVKSSPQNGTVPIWFYKDYINNRFLETQSKLKRWEEKLNHFGILVTHINPHTDPRCENCEVSSYDISMENKLWATTGSPNKINFLGGDLYSNSGRGSVRSNILRVD